LKDLILDKQKLLSELYNQIISELSKEELGAEITESDEYWLNPEMKILNMRLIRIPE
jgi:predicted component of type VI protein secretion system